MIYFSTLLINTLKLTGDDSPMLMMMMKKTCIINIFSLPTLDPNKSNQMSSPAVVLQLPTTITATFNAHTHNLMKCNMQQKIIKLIVIILLFN